MAISSSVRAWSGMLNRSPARGARPPGRKTRRNSANSGAPKDFSAYPHARAVIGWTGKPSDAYRMAGSKSVSNGRRPKRPESSTQAETAPGTVTEFQPRGTPPPDPGAPAPAASRCFASKAAGERPEALRPCSSRPSHRMQKASEPMPLPVGSRIVMVMAVATAASTALPPFCSMARPAWAASACDVATTLRAITTGRCEE